MQQIQILDFSKFDWVDTFVFSSTFPFIYMFFLFFSFHTYVYYCHSKTSEI